MIPLRTTLQGSIVISLHLKSNLTAMKKNSSFNKFIWEEYLISHILQMASSNLKFCLSRKANISI